ncbi:hypothetical protein B296_00045819 [Ensete ventricosum]|uniref:Uncharacterized protein n=1 Tax=Ensete ventricosum TaxID=4639 RepID=A0A426Y391_ENSVE|nr:hypothetical protein B296_00045819 [Ensete ventricosum]
MCHALRKRTKLLRLPPYDSSGGYKNWAPAKESVTEFNGTRFRRTSRVPQGTGLSASGDGGGPSPVPGFVTRRRMVFPAPSEAAAGMWSCGQCSDPTNAPAPLGEDDHNQSSGERDGEEGARIVVPHPFTIIMTRGNGGPHSVDGDLDAVNGMRRYEDHEKNRIRLAHVSPPNTTRHVNLRC